LCDFENQEIHCDDSSNSPACPARPKYLILIEDDFYVQKLACADQVIVHRYKKPK